MRVDLRGLHAGMAQQLLDNSKVSAAVQHVSGEAMPQSMRVSRRRRPPIQYTPYVPRAEPVPRVEEKGLFWRTRDGH